MKKMRLNRFNDDDEMKETSYMNVGMVSRYLHVAESTIYRWVGMNFIPHAKLHTRTVFVREQIDSWLMRNVIAPSETPEFPKFL